jgi:O-methyltransferase
VVECGCYIGGTSINLSLVCALAGRKLVIHDSVAGLPDPTDTDQTHVNVHPRSVDQYYEGRFAADLSNGTGKYCSISESRPL